MYGALQYEPYSFTYGIYNPQHLEHIPVSIYLDDVLLNTVNASNNKELTCSLTPNEFGSRQIKFEVAGYYRQIPFYVHKTDMDLHENETNLILSLSALGRTNEDVNKDK
jgi:hypothetical protein